MIVSFPCLCKNIHENVSIRREWKHFVKIKTTYRIACPSFNIWRKMSYNQLKKWFVAFNYRRIKLYLQYLCSENFVSLKQNEIKSYSLLYYSNIFDSIYGYKKFWNRIIYQYSSVWLSIIRVYKYIYIEQSW